MNFAKILAIFQVITSLLPAVKDFIIAVENAIPASGQGSAKLALVKAFVQNLFSTIQGVETTFEEVWPSMQTLIGGLVSIYNSIGVFTKATSTSATQTPK